MPPTLHCIRHAQGYHNLSIAAHTLHDPDLTPLGQTQCLHLQKTLIPPSSQISLIIASPMKRTLNTALQTFRPNLLANPELKIIALPELQETSDLPCDTGSSIEELLRLYADEPVDFSRVPVGWECKRGKWAPTATAIEARAREARRWLRARREGDVVVVSHGGFLHYLTHDWSDSFPFHGTGWANTEFRSYQFVTPQQRSSKKEGEEGEEEDEEAFLVELPESKHRRAADSKGLDHNEITQLKRTGTEEMKKRSGELGGGV